MTRTAGVRIARWSVLASGIAAVALAVGACSPGHDPVPASTLTADEAWERYGAMLGEVEAALTTTYPSLEWSVEPPHVRIESTADGGCSLVLGSISSTDSLLRSDPDLVRAREALDPVLARYGYPPLSDPSSNRAKMTFVESRSADGSWFDLSSRNRSHAHLPAIPLNPADCISDTFTPPVAPGGTGLATTATPSR